MGRVGNFARFVRAGDLPGIDALIQQPCEARRRLPLMTLLNVHGRMTNRDLLDGSCVLLTACDARCCDGAVERARKSGGHERNPLVLRLRETVSNGVQDRGVIGQP